MKSPFNFPATLDQKFCTQAPAANDLCFSLQIYFALEENPLMTLLLVKREIGYVLLWQKSLLVSMPLEGCGIRRADLLFK